MSSLKKASIISYISVAFYIVTGFIYTPYLIKTLGVSDYGIFSMAASLIGYFSIDFGLSAAITRLTARFLAQNRPDKIRDMLGITVKVYLVIDTIILVLLCLVYTNAETLFTRFSEEEIVKFKYVFIINAIYILINFPMLPMRGLYQAYEMVTELVTIGLIERVVSFTALMLALFWGFGLYGVVVINAISSITAQFFRLFYLYKTRRPGFNLRARDSEISSFVFSFSSWATVAMIADKMFFGIIPTLLGLFTNTVEIALFAVVISIEGYTLSFSKALSGVFLARVTKMTVSDSDMNTRTNYMIRVGRIQLYVIGFIVFALISFGRSFFFFWLGPGFDKSYYCVVLVLTPCVFHLTQTIAEEFIYASNNVKYKALVNIVGSIISIVCIALIAPKHGAYGAAIGVFLSFVMAHNILIDILYYKKMHLNMFLFFQSAHLKILPVFIIMTILALIYQHFSPIQSIVHLFFLMGSWLLVTFGLLYYISMNDEEHQILRQLIRRK